METNGDHGSFEIVGSKLYLKAGVIVDYEVQSSYSLQVTATDSGGIPFTKDFTIEVIDVNDVAPTISGDLAIAVDEAGSVVLQSGDLGANDADTIASDLVFSVSSSPDNGHLALAASPSVAISSFTSQQLLDQSVLYVHDGSETISDSLALHVSDGIASSIDVTLNVTVNPKNDDPTDILLSSLTITENTDTSSAFEVGTLSATDEDISDTHTFVLEANGDHGSFDIVGNKLYLNAGVVVDYEVQSSYSVQVTATDSGGSSFTKDFTIEVTDVNEAPVLAQTHTFTGGHDAEATGVSISYSDLLELVDDPENDTIVFTVMSIDTTNTNELSIDGVPVVPGVTTFSNSDTESLIWKPNSGLIGVASAFTVRASDGVFDSLETMQVNVLLGPIMDDLAIWLDANLGIVEDGSGKVEQWEDQSGNNHHFVQTDSQKRPGLLENALNSNSAVVFNGTTENLVHDLTTDYQGDSTIFIVYTVDSEQSLDTGKTLLSTGQSATDAITIELDGKPTSGMQLRTDGNNIYPLDESALSGTSVENRFAIFTISVSGDQLRTFENGKMLGLASTLASQDATNHQVYNLGSDNGSDYLSCQIAEVLIYHSGLVDEDRENVEQYLKTKYDLTALPAVDFASLDNHQIVASAEQQITVNASDVDGTVAGVELFVNGSSIGTVTQAPYEWTWYPTSAGYYELSAIGTDDVGTSKRKTITVQAYENSLPSSESHKLALWLRADAGVELTTDNAVTTWADQSLNGADLVAQLSSEPQWLEIDAAGATGSISGKAQLIRFDGVDDWLESESEVDYEGDSTLFIVYRVDGNSDAHSAGDMLLTTDEGDSNGMRLELDGSSPNHMLVASNGHAYDLGDMPTSKLVVLTVKVDSVNHTMTFYQNGTQLGTPISSIGTDASSFLKYRLGGSTNFLDCDIAEMLVYHTALADTDRQQVESYLTGRYPNPILQITQPTLNQIVELSNSNPETDFLTINATLGNYTGPVQSVRFYSDGLLIGEDTTAETGQVYSYAWTGPKAGLHKLHAEMADHLGRTYRTTQVSVLITNSTVGGSVAGGIDQGGTANHSPRVLDVYPRVGDTIATQGGSVSLIALYEDDDNDLNWQATQILDEFGNNLLANAPVILTENGVAVDTGKLASGTYTYTLKVYDTNGNVTEVTLTFTVDADLPTLVAMPAGGRFTEPIAGVVLSAGPGTGDIATVYYSVDGSTPSTELSLANDVYTTPAISSTTNLQFYAVDINGNQGSIQQEIYFLGDVPEPIAADSLTAEYDDNNSVVNLSWSVPDSSNTGYYIYRAVNPTDHMRLEASIEGQYPPPSYLRVNAETLATTSYGDTSFTLGAEVVYGVTWLDANGNESVISSLKTVDLTTTTIAEVINESIARASQWLALNQQQVGAWDEASAMVDQKMLATSAAINGLTEAEGWTAYNNNAVNRGLMYLHGQFMANTTALACAIDTLQRHGKDTYREQLLLDLNASIIRERGDDVSPETILGWGMQNRYSPDAYNTAWGIIAREDSDFQSSFKSAARRLLLATGDADVNPMDGVPDDAIQIDSDNNQVMDSTFDGTLLQARDVEVDPDGDELIRFGWTPSNNYSVFTSALVYRALGRNRPSFQIIDDDPDLDTRYKWILSQQIDSGDDIGAFKDYSGAPSILATAAALQWMPLSTVEDGTGPRDRARKYLLAAQLPNGSWENNAYLTGFCLEAMVQRKALLVCQSTPDAADNAVKQALELRGFDVETNDGSETSYPATIDDYSLVIIAGSTDVAGLFKKYHDVNVPVIVSKAGAFPKMGLTGSEQGTDWGTDASTAIDVASIDNHLLTAERAGQTSLPVTTTGSVAWGVPNSSAQIIALSSDNDKPVLFAYERNALMSDGSLAPARRVGFFLESGGEMMISDAQDLLDAAIQWATNRVTRK